MSHGLLPEAQGLFGAVSCAFHSVVCVCVCEVESERVWKSDREISTESVWVCACVCFRVCVCMRVCEFVLVKVVRNISMHHTMIHHV